MVGLSLLSFGPESLLPWCSLHWTRGHHHDRGSWLAGDHACNTRCLSDCVTITLLARPPRNGRLKRRKNNSSVPVSGELLQTVMLSGWSNQMHVTLLGTRVPCFGLVFVSSHTVFRNQNRKKKRCKKKGSWVYETKPIEKVRSEMIESMSAK